jgi:hypothetical protein
MFRKKGSTAKFPKSRFIQGVYRFLSGRKARRKPTGRKAININKGIMFLGNLDIWIKSLNFNISPFRPLGSRGYSRLT